MFGLTPLGTIHTFISLVALAAGFASILRDGRIVPAVGLGRTYIWSTVITCLTGFGIFERGGFGPPHVLGILTLLALALAGWQGGARWLGARWLYVSTVCYSLTLFFHMIPGVTETFTRVPAGRPLFTGPDDPSLQKLAGAMFAIFLVGATLQVLHLRRVGRASQQVAPLQGARKSAR
jgi:hypothetical protein